MAKYRDFFEPSLLSGGGNTDFSRNLYFSKIKVATTKFDDGSTCFTDVVKAPLFGNVPLKTRLVRLVAEQLSFFFNKYRIKSSSLILVAGIGNENVTADSFGCKVCDGLICTAHDYKNSSHHGNLAFVKCGIAGISGIESYDHLTAVKDSLSPDMIIVTDTLASSNIERLSKAIQISDRGMSPGKGVGNEKTLLSKNTLSVPTVAIGIPLVISVKRILADCCQEINPDKIKDIDDLTVTSKDVDFTVADFAYIVSSAINSAIHSQER